MELLRMPRASENMVEGTVGEWLLSVGDSCEPQAAIVEIITEKAQFELECEIGGIIREILATPRSTVPVNFILAVIADSGESFDLDQINAENNTILSEHLKATIGDISIASTKPAVKKRASGKIAATPRARRLAKTSGVDLQDVKTAFDIDGIVEEKHVKSFLAKQ